MNRGLRRSRPRRRIGVPRGMLRHLVLSILKHSPMSGSELTTEIETHTDWRPSPGAIYPLIANLWEEGFIEPSETDDPSLKRFALTEEGRAGLSEMHNIEEQVRRRNSSILRMYWILLKGMTEDVYAPFSRVMNAIDNVVSEIKTDDDKTTLKLVLEKAAQEIERMVDDKRVLRGEF